jgi:hypothetical protein
MTDNTADSIYIPHANIRVQLRKGAIKQIINRKDNTTLHHYENKFVNVVSGNKTCLQ